MSVVMQVHIPESMTMVVDKRLTEEGNVCIYVNCVKNKDWVDHQRVIDAATVAINQGLLRSRLKPKTQNHQWLLKIRRWFFRC